MPYIPIPFFIGTLLPQSVPLQVITPLTRPAVMMELMISTIAKIANHLEARNIPVLMTVLIKKVWLREGSIALFCSCTVGISVNFSLLDSNSCLEQLMQTSIPRRREFSEQFRDLAQLHEQADVPRAKWEDASRLFPKQFGIPPSVAITIWWAFLLINQMDFFAPGNAWKSASDTYNIVIGWIFTLLNRTIWQNYIYCIVWWSEFRLFFRYKKVCVFGYSLNSCLENTHLFVFSSTEVIYCLFFLEKNSIPFWCDILFSHTECLVGSVIFQPALFNCSNDIRFILKYFFFCSI